MPQYTVERRNLASGKRPFFRHVVVNPGGIVMGDSFNDIGGEQPAQKFADVLNKAFEEGRLAGLTEASLCETGDDPQYDRRGRPILRT